MRPIAPRTGAQEITIAEHQHEYLPVTVAIYRHSNGTRSLLTRWTLTPEEREQVAKGEDIYISQLGAAGSMMTPMTAQVSAGWWADPDDGSLTR